MKKLIVIAALSFSMVAFAKNHGLDSKPGMMKQTNMKAGMTQQMNQLNPDQQLQLEKLQLKYQNKNQEYMLMIKKVDLEIEKEMSAEKVDTKKIGKLVDRRAQIQTKMHRSMINYRLDAKEKFGMDTMGAMMGTSGKMTGNMDQMMSNMNEMMKNMSQMMNNMHEMMGGMNQVVDKEKIPQVQE